MPQRSILPPDALSSFLSNSITMLVFEQDGDVKKMGEHEKEMKATDPFPAFYCIGFLLGAQFTFSLAFFYIQHVN